MLLLPGLTSASEMAGPHYKVKLDPTDKASLQRGMKYFVNYCLNCHSANFMRYSRAAKDLGISKDVAIKNLMFTASKFGEHMKIAMKPADSKKWFGNPPPDLSVIARTKKEGADWLYTYLLTFYVDDSRPFGVNNLKFPNVGMPDVLWELQGLQKPIYKTVMKDGKEHHEFDHFELVQAGKLSDTEYKAMVKDLVNFLAYMSEPSKHERTSMGIWVLLFLVVFFLVAYPMKKEFWKDIH
jgi:ubiquinol-cytochrome c reductase cytochrome c1 subunit